MRKTIPATLLIFCVLSLVLTYPLSLHLATAVEDRQDALLNVWITAWGEHQLLTDPLHLFDANIFYPYPRTLAYSELLLGNVLLALPITALSGNPVLGYNVALLLSFILSALGTCLLTLRLTRSAGAGLVAGIAFAFSSYRLTNLAQAQLLTTQWLPFALLSLHLVLYEGRRRHALTFVLFFCLQVLSSFYYGVLLALAVVGYWGLGIGYWILGIRDGGRGANSARGTNTQSLISNTKYLLVAGVVIALILVPFVRPYFQVQEEMGFERTLADSEPFSASLRQYVTVPPHSVVYEGILPSDDQPIAGGYPVDALFPGVVLLGLAAWGLIRGRRTAWGQVRWYFVLLALAALVLSWGPRLYLAPGELAGLDGTLPYGWLYALVPGFKALRAPVRFDVLVSLALAVLAGYGAAALERSRLPERVGGNGLGGRKTTEVVPTSPLSEAGSRRQATPAGMRWPTLVLAALVAIEALVWPAAKAEPVPVSGEVPEVYGWLDGQPPGPILELPMAFTPGGPQLEYQYFSTYHWQPTPDGYSGFVPPRHGQIVYEMAGFPAERSVRLLQALAVRHVVVHTDRLPAERRQEIEAALAATAAIVPVAHLGPDVVYRVEPGVFDPATIEGQIYLPAAAAVGQAYTAYAVLSNRGDASYAVAPTEVVEASVVWQGSGGELTSVTGGDPPLVISPGGAAVVPLEVVAPGEPGTYHLSVVGTTRSGGEWHATGDVAVGVDPAPGVAFPVPVRLADWSLPDVTRGGEGLPVTLTWHALGKIDAYYSVYVKLFDAGGNAVAGWDGEPGAGARPTLLWVPG